MSSAVSAIEPNLSRVRERLKRACIRAGRDPGGAHLIAVSKLQPVALIEEAYRLGVRDFGENYARELAEKRRALKHLPGLRWHLIGPLQTNKAKAAVENADFFHALDSEKLALELCKRVDRIDRLAGRDRPFSVFLQVNLDGEASKSGVAPEDAGGLAAFIRAKNELRLEGLMCIPEPRPPERMRPAFQRLRELANTIGGEPLALSMGMSEDFEVAVEEGANWVRVGRAIFGERPSR
ncbi:MAG: YggS family pyridoxal phosphate-dependent enzyme [Deltaproteobacteria bacterium]|nr:YggS family pyridoxal phosphate-dependent enzyme [Deltaproteobacteria bacterium]